MVYSKSSPPSVGIQQAVSPPSTSLGLSDDEILPEVFIGQGCGGLPKSTSLSHECKTGSLSVSGGNNGSSMLCSPKEVQGFKHTQVNIFTSIVANRLQGLNLLFDVDAINSDSSDFSDDPLLHRALALSKETAAMEESARSDLIYLKSVIFILTSNIVPSQML